MRLRDSSKCQNCVDQKYTYLTIPNEDETCYKGNYVKYLKREVL